FYVMPMMARCPVVVTVHDLIPFKFQIYSPAKTLVVKSGYRLACRKATHIIAVSQTTAEDIVRIIRTPAQKITTVHNAVSRQRFHAHALPQETATIAEKFGLRTPYIVVASARNWKTKNLGTALEALEIASRQTGQNFQTAIYGPGDGFNAAGGEGRWKLLNPVRLGYLKNEELAMLFRHANGFVFPSLYEGFGLPILEAMACGCPVITSSGGALAEVAGNGAQVFDPRDAEGMARAVIRLLNDPEQREQWRLSGLARAAEFSWERAARETLAVYYRTYNQAYGS
ncbi:MAG TPA: glycosyltransferase family 1 protein, partial [Candidatus Angelobacter sp.]|nr:glycosyltransferase family 1 protein [Candidatus Angelobacter sp.]